MNVDSAIAELRAGGVVAYPTETFFALGADPTNELGMAALLERKSRDLQAGVPLITDSVERVEQIIAAEDAGVAERRRSLLARYWPGPLTLVLKPHLEFARSLRDGVLAADGTIAVRQSSCEFARQLAAGLGGFITSTSANPKAAPPPTALAEVRTYFPDLLVVGEDIKHAASASILPSTLINVAEFPFRIIREGAVSRSQLAEFLA